MELISNQDAKIIIRKNMKILGWLDRIYLITKHVAETDSIGEGYDGYWYGEYTTEHFIEHIRKIFTDRHDYGYVSLALMIDESLCVDRTADWRPVLDIVTQALPNRIKQHVPNFVDIRSKPKEADFETLEELMEIDWVKQWSDACDNPVFKKRGDHLMITGTRRNMKWWWVIGTLDNPHSIDLPIWEGVQNRS